MCGIAGICYKESPIPEPSPLGEMLQSLKHRGPDDAGTYFYRNVSLGHNRLSIIDISSAGHQPMKYKDFVITYNGEIYNYLEVKEELKDRGHVFITQTDTEVLLHAYEVWGEDCLQRMTGMWAFAILDQNRNQLFCSRDRFGIKPFYYYCDEKILFAFASEIKGLLTSLVKHRVNYERLLDYLLVGLADHTEETFYPGIRQLLPGHSLLVKLESGEKELKRYYSLADHPEWISTAEDFEKYLRKSVEIHMRSDVPVGTCLSGGIDSSVIAALASEVNRKNGNQVFSAITAQSEFSGNDETPYARQVIEHCHLDWHITRPTFEDFQAGIENCMWFQEEPVGSPSVFMQFCVMKTAKEVGLKVMLDGQGGDELMFGYERYYASFFWYLLRQKQAYTFFREFLLASRHSKLNLPRMAAFSFYFLFPILRKMILEKRSAFLKKEYVQLGSKRLRSLARSFWDIHKLQVAEITGQQLPHLLKYEDRNSMAHSIEARVPFIEMQCVESSVRIPPQERIKDGFTKYPLRKIAEKIVPPAIAWRRHKFGFEAPTSLWLKKLGPSMVQEIRNSRILGRVCRFVPALDALDWEMQWRLYNIALWERLFDVQA
jgi:asparagine synthase (glutamine-hydrolysing)